MKKKLLALAVLAISCNAMADFPTYPSAFTIDGTTYSFAGLDSLYGGGALDYTYSGHGGTYRAIVQNVDGIFTVTQESFGKVTPTEEIANAFGATTIPPVKWTTLLPSTKPHVPEVANDNELVEGMVNIKADPHAERQILASVDNYQQALAEQRVNKNAPIDKTKPVINPIVIDHHHDSSAKREHLANMPKPHVSEVVDDTQLVEPIIQGTAKPIVVTPVEKQDQQYARGKATPTYSEPATTTPIYHGDSQRPNTGPTGQSPESTVAGKETKPVITPPDNKGELVAYQKEVQRVMQKEADYYNEQLNLVNGQLDTNTDMIIESQNLISDTRMKVKDLQDHDRKQDKRIESVNKHAMAGVASALAITGLHYTDSANSMAIGAGNYGGANAMAIGYSHQWGNNIRASVQNSVDSLGNVGSAASLAIGW